jgi:protein TonB
MAYGDSVDPKNRVVAIFMVGLITFLLGWLLVSGLAIDVVKKVAAKLDVVDVQEPPPPEEPPPPPPPDNKLPPPPPVVIPKSILPPVSTNTVTNAVDTPPPPQPPAPVITPPAPPAPPATPDRSRPVRPRGNEQTWVTTDDYPPSSLREEAQGTTATRISVGPDGRVTDCQVTGSSGNAALDQAACRNIQRRARFEPALDRDGNPTASSYSKRVRWQLPAN